MKKINAKYAVKNLIDKIIEYLDEAFIYDEETAELPLRINNKLKLYLSGKTRNLLTEKYFAVIFAEEFGDELDDDMINDCKKEFKHFFDCAWNSCHIYKFDD